MKFFLVIMIIFSAVSVEAQTNDKCKSLDNLIGKISNKKLYNYSSVNKIFSLSRTSKCDVGAYAGNMAEIVVKSLALDFIRTLKVAGKNKNVEEFVAGHVNATASNNDLKKVLDNSQSMCTNDKKDLCRKLELNVKIAMKESI